MIVSQHWKVNQVLFLYVCIYIWSRLPDTVFLEQDHCATLETQIEALRCQFQLYDLSESEGGDVDQSKDHGEEAEDDDVGADEEGEDSVGSSGDDDIAGDDE